MIITNNRTLNALDALFNAAELIAHYDYVAVGNRIINWLVIAAAIIIGTTDYLVTAVRLFWLENGESIMTNAVRFTLIIADAAGATYYAGRKLRPVINQWTNRIIDRVYFAAAAL